MQENKIQENKLPKLYLDLNNNIRLKNIISSMDNNWQRGAEANPLKQSTKYYFQLIKSTTRLLGLDQWERYEFHNNPLRIIQSGFKRKILAIEENRNSACKSQDGNRKPSQSAAFVATDRQYHYKNNEIPGPGIYSKRGLADFPTKGYVNIGMKGKWSDQKIQFHQEDFFDSYDSQLQKIKFQRVLHINDFNKDMSREDALFTQQTIQQKLKHRNKQQNSDQIDNDKIENEIKWLNQQKYSRTVDKPIKGLVRRIEGADAINNQWMQLLTDYGFKRVRGKIYKQIQN